MAGYRAAVLTAPNCIEIKELSPRELEHYEARIAVKYAGICGTDIAIYTGNYQVPLPLVLGHELVGVVEEVGDPQYSYLIGKTVVAEINNTCISRRNEKLCPACFRGLPSHCLQRTVLGIIKAPGAFAEQVIVPCHNIHILPADISPIEIGVFVEPLAAAIQTFELTPLVRNTLVVVLGAGRLGILVALVSAHLGADTIIADRDVKKLDLARKLIRDIDTCSTADADKFIRYIHQRSNQLGADIVVEATGNPQALALALNICRPRGTIALKSTPGVPQPVFDGTRTVVNEIRLQGSRCGPFDKAIQFIQTFKPPLTSLIAEIYPLHYITHALKQATICSKVLIKNE